MTTQPYTTPAKPEKRPVYTRIDKPEWFMRKVPETIRNIEIKRFCIIFTGEALLMKKSVLVVFAAETVKQAADGGRGEADYAGENAGEADYYADGGIDIAEKYQEDTGAD